MIIDTHAHYDDSQYDEDRDSLIKSLIKEDVGIVINSAADLKGCRDAIKLAHTYPFFYANVGIHPSEVGLMTEDTIKELKKLAADEKVVAIGEIGLDYYYEDNPEREVQKHWFRRQLELAAELNMKVVIHSRDAAADTLEMLKEASKLGVTGDVHCYSYSVEQAREYVKMGYYIGVGGAVTFKNSKKLKEVVKEISIDNIIIETDCPYMAPEPVRGTRNNSANLKYVVAKIAELKNITEQEVLEITEKNARDLFGIK